MSNWIAIVDDDKNNLRIASHILTQENMKVSCMKSGKELLKFLNGNHPDLLLLDIHMPEMNGFETLSRVRNLADFSDLPVVFLMGDEDTGAEAKCLNLGAIDFIKKPFVAEILLLRIRQALELYRLRNDLLIEVERKTKDAFSNHENINTLKTSAEIDSLTGLLNKLSAQAAINTAVHHSQGIFLIVDIDSFKSINDLYGRDNGDKILVRISDIIKSTLRSSDIAGRLVDDKFVAYIEHIANEDIIKEKNVYINDELLAYAKEILGEDMNVPLGVSVGAVMCPDEGTDYTTLYQKADEALCNAKQSGKHECLFFWTAKHPHPETVLSGSSQAVMILQERTTPTEAMLLTFEKFRTVFRLLSRLKSHDGIEFALINFTLEYTTDDINRQTQLLDAFCKHVTSALRTGDAVTKTASNQCMAMLVNTNHQFSDDVAMRIIESWNKNDLSLECMPGHEIILIS